MTKVQVPLFPGVSPETLGGVLDTYPVTTRQTVGGMRDFAFALNRLANTVSALGIPVALVEGGSGTANKNTIDAAVSVAASHGGGVLVLPTGTFTVKNVTIANVNNVVIVGQGNYFGGTVLRPEDAAGNFITFEHCGNCGISNVLIDGTVVRKVGGYGVVHSSNIGGNSWRPFIEKVACWYVFNAFSMEGVTEGRIRQVETRFLMGDRSINMMGTASNPNYRVTINDYSGDNPYPSGSGPGTFKTWTTGTGFSLNDCIANNNKIYQCSQAGTSAGAGTGPSGIPGSGGADAFTAEIVDGTAKWRFVCSAVSTHITQDSYTYSLVMNQIAAIGMSTGYQMLDSINSGTSYPIWAFFWDFESDHPVYSCVNLSRGEGVYISGSWLGSSCQSDGMGIGPNFRGEVFVGAGTRIMGNWFHGLLIQNGPVDVDISGCVIGDNSVSGSGATHGIAVGANATRFNIIGNRSGDLVGVSGNNQSYGIFISSGTSDYYNVIGNNLVGNVNGGVSDGGTGIHKTVLGNSGSSTPARVFPALASDPTGAAGDFYYNTTTNLLKFHNGTAWGNV